MLGGMNHPWAMAAANEVVAAARAAVHARIPNTSSYPQPESERLRRAVEAYELAIFQVHVQGPNLDADRPDDVAPDAAAAQVVGCGDAGEP